MVIGLVFYQMSGGQKSEKNLIKIMLIKSIMIPIEITKIYPDLLDVKEVDNPWTQ